MKGRFDMRRAGAAIAALLMVGFAACGGDHDEHDHSEHAAMQGEEGMPAAHGNGNGEGVPVYGEVPDFALTNQSGTAFARQQLEGRTWVADFIFTRCTDICPRLTARMVELQARLDEAPHGRGVQLVSFSVDPEYDRPAVLSDYADQYGADAARWTFATGGREEIWELSKAGFKLPVGEAPGESDQPLFHSDRFVLVDGQGQIRGYYPAMDAGEGIESLLGDLETLHAEAPLEEEEEESSAARTVGVPAGVGDVPWLEQRAAEQKAAAAGWKAFHDFRFVDEQPKSGINWTHAVVEDAAKAHKPVHYDHGTGVAVADVDGDGRLDVYFVNQLGNNALWRNKGGGVFEDVTYEAGLPLFDRICVGAAFADIDNDGDPDLYVTSVKDGNVLFENDGKGKFTDITDESGTGYVGHSSGAVFFDYDKDGMLDLLVLNIGVYTTDARGPGRYFVGVKDAFGGHLVEGRSEKSRLFRNLGKGRFEDVTEKTGFDDTRWSGAASPIDANGDGWPDIFMLNMQGLDGYWENQGGKGFVDKTKGLFPKSSWGAMGVKVFDFDNDGDMDIYVTDMHSDMSADVPPLPASGEKRKAFMTYPPQFLQDDRNGIYGNSFFRNDGGSFAEVSDEIGAENYWPWGLSVGDLNADGYQDAFLASSMNYPFRYAVNSLLLNDAGKGFLDAEFVLGVEPRRDGATTKPWFEIDCAGDDRYHKDCPKDGTPGRVQVVGSLGSRSSAIFDLEGDGDLDIVTNEFGAEPLVLVSDLSAKTSVAQLQVKLVGTKSNRDGLGARVTVEAGGRSYVQVHDGQSGYLSQSVKPLYFGLAGAPKVDAITVAWPSGTEQKLPGPIEIGRVLTVTEPN